MGSIRARVITWAAQHDPRRGGCMAEANARVGVGAEEGDGAVSRSRKYRARTREQWIEEFAVPEPNSGCWLWTGTYSSTGYGHVTYVDKGVQVKSSPHRLSHELYIGPIPAGYHVDHLCRNRACCNPDHLEAVTPRVNQARSPIALATINSAKTHCKWGHPFEGDNLYVYPSGGRGCRECMRSAQKANPPRTHSAAPLPDDDPRHGTRAGYKYWMCRCAPCKEAGRDEGVRRSGKRRAARSERAPLPEADPRHGTLTGYTYWRCRCDECRKVHAEDLRAQRKAAALRAERERG